MIIYILCALFWQDFGIAYESGALKLGAQWPSLYHLNLWYSQAAQILTSMPSAPGVPAGPAGPGGPWGPGGPVYNEIHTTLYIVVYSFV